MQEIRRVKARVDAERLPRGADPQTHFKLGPGGLSDIEWTVQALQMRHAHRLPAMRTTRTFEALDAAVEAEVITADDADDLRHAWLMASRLRNATVQVRGRSTDQLPHDARQLAAVSAVLLEEADYLRLLEDLAALQVLNLVFSGGEPLAHPDFWRIGRRARELGLV